MIPYSKIFRTSELSRLDTYTIENEPIKSIDLMERAARAVVEKLQKKYPGTPVFNILVGPGNNGGDGYAIARLLSVWNRHVKVFAVNGGAQRSMDCLENYRRYRKLFPNHVDVLQADDLRLDPGAIIIDALFGAGLNRPVTGLFADVIRKVNEAHHVVVSIDMPSGLMGEDNRHNDGAIIRSTYTYTFQFPKLALMLSENCPYVGHWEVLPIGLHPCVLAETPSRYYYINSSAVASRLLPLPKFAHKGTLGHALLVAGSSAMPGAAILAARGAIRSGCGLLSVLVPADVRPLLLAAVPEALVDAHPLDDMASYDFARFSALGAGPGIPATEFTWPQWHRLLTSWRGKTVLDAGLLTLLAAHPDTFDELPPCAILTPHPGEFERLVGKTENDFDRLNKLATFARQHQLIVVLKGAHTVVASPDGDLYFNATGNPGMAKGGSGDVLTGVILALLASGHEPLDAAIIGIHVHGLAGDKAAARHGQRGMRAGDMADQLGAAWLLLEKQ